MEIIPAIDLLAGRCVRLRQGDYDAATVHSDDPVAVARAFFAAGARRLHLVDLDAAKTGTPLNRAVILSILAVARDYQATVEIGGGLRSVKAVADILDAGAGYAVVGTAAVRDDEFRRQIIKQFPQQIIIGVDVKAGELAVAGWRENSHISERDFIADLHDTPPAAIIYTDISRDGMLSGSNVSATAAAAAAAPCPLIASGGIGQLSDIQALNDCGNIAGVIIGKALYAETIALADALALSV